MYICFMLFFNYGYPGARCMFWGGGNAGRALACYALQLVQTASWQQGVCVFSTLTWRSCKWLPTYCLLWRRSGDWARGCWLGEFVPSRWQIRRVCFDPLGGSMGIPASRQWVCVCISIVCFGGNRGIGPGAVGLGGLSLAGFWVCFGPLGAPWGCLQAGQGCVFVFICCMLTHLTPPPPWPPTRTTHTEPGPPTKTK